MDDHSGRSECGREGQNGNPEERKNDIRDVGSTADLVLVYLVLLVPTGTHCTGNHCIGTHWYPMVPVVPVGTRWYPLVPTGTNWFPLVPTGTHWYPLIPTGTHLYSLVLTGTQ